MLLALYDLRSKQEYIYRTNKIREISGGSALLSKVYERFISKAQENENGIKLANNGDWRKKNFSLKTFEASDCSAEVVYIGGGNLMVIYKDEEIYRKANKIFSHMLLDETWSVTAVVSCVEVTGDFIADRNELYRQNATNKSIGVSTAPCSVLPFTQIDMRTYMPIVEKNKFKQESLSRESVCKLNAFEMDRKDKLSAIYLDDLVADKGRESILAAIYIDGNNMGAKLMQTLGEGHDYDQCINTLRRFSERTAHDFVEAPVDAIEKMLNEKQDAKISYAKYRRVIAGGDEITLICNARIVPEILDVYFNTLDSKNSGNYACAGVAIFHSHAPFADVYEIAEQCCESGKKCSRQYGSNANFVDFHYCRAGITNDMDIVRKKQENGLTARPYRVDGEHEGYSYSEFNRFAKKIKVIGRANIKELAASLIKGESYYRFEIERINSRFKDIHIESTDERSRKMIFDIAQVYDLWFAGEGGKIMRGYIYITLKSDLCAASGDGFSLSIDTDVCSDRYGLPFIPSRRLKGCLKEAAEYIGCDRIDSIFGVSGNDISGSLRINDAKLEDYELLWKQAEKSKYSAEKVLNLFTSVKASTAIENDTAKENSLRFTRVVNHFSPFDGKELVFVSEIEYAESDEDHLKNICLALRNIGFKRTRGYGSVRCMFKRSEDKKALEVNIPDDDNEYELWLTTRLRSSAMFPGKSSVETMDYIPGNTLLGAFAGGYLKNGGDESDFDRLFLSGVVKFSNMYISDGKMVSEPVPAVLGKAKDSGEIRFVFRDEDNDASRPLIKAFKGGYMINGSEIKPEKEVIYHHGKKQGEEGKLLYTQECLCEGQFFSGTVRGIGKDLRKLLPAIASGRINLGRSKSAQYSACDIVKAKCVPVINEESATGKVFALLCSDVLTINDNAEFSVGISDFAKALGIENKAVDAAHSSLKYKTVMGYISVGRYKRSHIRAFEKGSVLCFDTKTALPKYLTIGERQNEGFGNVRICTKEELMLLGKAIPENDEDKTSKAINDNRLLELVNRNEERERLRLAALEYADKQYDNVKGTFNAAFVGRLLLMVSQAVDEPDLDKRVASIKTEIKRKKAQSFIDNAAGKYGDDWREFLKIAITVIKYRLKEAGYDE